MSGLGKSYMFRIKFQTPESESLDIPKGNKIEACLYDELKITLKDVSKEGNETHVYILTGGPFKSVEEARDIGTKVIKYLFIFFAKIGKGFSLGSFEPHFIITGAGKKYFKKLFGVQGEVLPDNFGLTIYENKQGTKFLSSNMKFVVPVSGENLISEVKNNIKLPIKFNERDLLTLDMFTSSFFEKTNSSRFIKLMICVESMLDFKKKDPEIRKTVDCLIKQMNESDIEPLKRNSLSSSLGKLKKESITEAGIRFCNENLSNTLYHNMLPGDFFKYCYDLRCNLLHEGEKSKDIDNILGTFVTFVGDLIKAKILS